MGSSPISGIVLCAMLLLAQGGKPMQALSVVGLNSISGLVAEYIVAIDVTRARFPADAFLDLLVPVPAQSSKNVLVCLLRGARTTLWGFEPLQAEPRGFRDHVKPSWGQHTLLKCCTAWPR